MLSFDLKDQKEQGLWVVGRDLGRLDLEENPLTKKLKPLNHQIFKENDTNGDFGTKLSKSL